MALRAPLDGGPCMLRSSFGDWEVAVMCFQNDSHHLVYKSSRSFVRKYAETLATDDGLQWDSAVQVVPWLNKMIYASFLYLFQIYDETCWFVKNIETNTNAEFVVFVMLKIALLSAINFVGSSHFAIIFLEYCENTKSVLIAASYIHLKHREQVKYTSEFLTVNPKILLSGPAGSEIYQEMLTKALARYFGAKLLIFDSHSFLGVQTCIKERFYSYGSRSEVWIQQI